MKNFYYYIPIFLQKVGWLLFGTIYKVFFHIEIRGKENLSLVTKPVILAANHTSELDVTAVELIFPLFSKFYPIYFVSDPKEKFKSFGWRNYIYGGVFFNVLGGYPIHSGHKDYAVSLENHIDLLKKGQTVFIFPEGKRTQDGSLNPARGGLGYMVAATDCMVVPIAINTFHNISWVDFFLRRKKVVITVLKPMTKEEIMPMQAPTVEDCRAGSQKVLDRINALLLNL